VTKDLASTVLRKKIDGALRCFTFPCLGFVFLHFHCHQVYIIVLTFLSKRKTTRSLSMDGKFKLVVLLRIHQQQRKNASEALSTGLETYPWSREFSFGDIRASGNILPLFSSVNLVYRNKQKRSKGQPASWKVVKGQ